MRPEALQELAHLSARLGCDPEQVQAAGGNTSLKVDDVLWVKASGLWLADAAERDIFVPVRLAPVLEAIAADALDPVSAAVIQERNAAGLRPSIETTLHALLPHPVVIHTHSVRTIALAIREDAQAALQARLDGLAWDLISYHHPGLPLTRAVAERLRRGPLDVLVLGNHGLVVGGATVAAAALLLVEVERRLEAPPRRHGPTNGRALAEAAVALDMRPVAHAPAHALAGDPQLVAWATTGSLYPDHVIFLGPGAVAAERDGPRRPAAGSKLVIVPGAGLLVPADATRAADELALCLAMVLERVPSDAALRYLSPENEAALLDWDAEKYRQELTRARFGAAC